MTFKNKGKISSTLLCGIACLSTNVTAQVIDNGRQQDREEKTPEIMVTASRIFLNVDTSATPSIFIGSEDIARTAPVNLADTINQFPALSGSVTPRSGGLATNAGANLLNLRSLGPNRTLVLLDRRRVAPTTLTGSVDISLLPEALVKRVDVVTGGVSAIWGSDAVAGVINFVLDDRFEGLKGSAQYGITSRGDGRASKFNLTYGGSFADDRLHIVLSGQHAEIAEIAKASSRDWFRGYNIINNPAFAPGNGEPARLVLPDVGLSGSTPGGLIASGPLRGTQFISAAETAPFDFGTVSGLLSAGGDAYILSQNAPIQNPVNSDQLFGRANFEISPAFRIFGEASYSKAETNVDVRFYQRDGIRAITIQRDNAFLPEAIRNQIPVGGTIQLGRVHADFGAAQVSTERKLTRFAAGAEGQISSSWTWDAYLQRGDSDFLVTTPNNTLVRNYELAVDAVAGFNGPVCRSTLSDPSNGCVPLNVFGDGSPSPQAIAYVQGSGRQLINIRQDVAAANIRGDLAQLEGGPLALALGVEYRKEKYTASADAISLSRGFFLGNFQPSGGEYDVKEGYIEVVAPLLRDRPFAKNLQLSGAVRLTDYSASGSVTTWKIGALNEIVDGVRIRVSRSRDIRAPNLNELFLASSTSNFTISDPVLGTAYTVSRVLAGNPDLKPERADTFSAGIQVRPSAIPGLSLSADYFNIKISDAISTPQPQTLLSQCQAGVTELCSVIIRNSSNAVTQIRVLPQNVQFETSKGLDLEVNYRRSLSGMNGEMFLRVLATHIFKRNVQTLDGSINYAGVSGDPEGTPSWTAYGTVGYDGGSFTASLSTRFISAGVIKAEWGASDISDNHVPSVAYFDLSASQRFPIPTGGDMQLFFTVRNLFDKAPPIAPNPLGNQLQTLGTNAVLYDIVGRSFTAGIRFKL